MTDYTVSTHPMALAVVTGEFPPKMPPGFYGAWDSILHRLIFWNNPSTESAITEHANSEFTAPLLAAAKDAGMLQSLTHTDGTVIWFFTNKGAQRWATPFTNLPQWAHLNPDL